MSGTVVLLALTVVVALAAAWAVRRRPGREWLWTGMALVLVASMMLLRLAAASGRPAGPPVIRGGSGWQATRSLVAIDSGRLRALEARIRTDSGNLPDLLEAGHLYLQLQRFDESARASLRAVSLDPMAAEAHAHLGMILWAGHDPHAALAALDRALRISPELPEALLYRGLVLFVQLRDYAAAAGALEHYLKVAPPGADTGRVRQMLDAARSQPTESPPL